MYPYFNEVLNIYIDASMQQIQVVMVQYYFTIAFFSRKWSKPQTQYTVTKLGLQSVLETLKLIKYILWDKWPVLALSGASNCVLTWNLL